MKKRTIPVLLLGLACHAGMAQKPQRDTLSLTSKIHQIDEVVVTGARHETDVRHLSQAVSVVGRAQIESALQPSLLPVLTEQVCLVSLSLREASWATVYLPERRAAFLCAD